MEIDHMTDFESIVMCETEEKYLNMLNNKTEMPYSIKPSGLASYSVYVKKQSDYHVRLNRELQEYNNALSKIKDSKTKELLKKEQTEADRKARKERANRRLKQYLKIIDKLLLCFLPILYSNYMGVLSFEDFEDSEIFYTLSRLSIPIPPVDVAATLSAIFLFVYIGAAIFLLYLECSDAECGCWSIIRTILMIALALFLPIGSCVC